MSKSPVPTARPALPTPRPEGAPAAFHLLAKPSGAACNLDCHYCFFLSKESLSPGGQSRASEDVLFAYVEQAIESHREPEVAIAFQGGEPTLLGVDVYRRVVAHARDFAGPGRPLAFSLQTNGTLLDDAWGRFLGENRFLVGLSIDGPRALHDAYRRDKGGHPTFDRVMRGARVLQQYGVELNVLCAVHAANAPHPIEVYRFFRDELRVPVIQLIPVVERLPDTLVPAARLARGAREAEGPARDRGAAPVTSRSVTPAEWGRFLIAIFDEWVGRDVGATFVTLFDATLANTLGVSAAECQFRPTCGDAPTLLPNGDVHPCDHFVEPGRRLGNLLETHVLEMLASPEQRSFGAAKLTTLPARCRACDVLSVCHGECPRNRFLPTDTGEGGLNYLCEGYRAFFRHVRDPMQRMAELLRSGRHADEIM